MKEVDKEGKKTRRGKKGRKERTHPPNAEFHHSIDGVLSCDL